jgi:hypothetical protein
MSLELLLAPEKELALANKLVEKIQKSKFLIGTPSWLCRFDEVVLAPYVELGSSTEFRGYYVLFDSVKVALLRSRHDWAKTELTARIAPIHLVESALWLREDEERKKMEQMEQIKREQEQIEKRRQQVIRDAALDSFLKS